MDSTTVLSAQACWAMFQSTSPPGVVAYFEAIEALSRLQEGARDSSLFLGDIAHSRELSWDHARDNIVLILMQGYIAPAKQDWASCFFSGAKLRANSSPSRCNSVISPFSQPRASSFGSEDILDVIGAAITAVRNFRSYTPETAMERYIVDFVLTLAVCHIGYLWVQRHEFRYVRLPRSDRDRVAAHVWLRAIDTVPVSKAPRFEDSQLEAHLFLNIGKTLFQLNAEIRLSAMLYPLFQLPALIEHWGLTSSFMERGTIRSVAKLLFNPNDRRRNVREMVQDLCSHVDPTSHLAEFISGLGVSSAM
ncbi:hypothetical protein C8R45DRAFT_945239 [Mycena sanguinolenta]|nr:hypothetical protein C8R45DRAFT_945239 [Mycena sanguinolenta]